MYPAYVGIFFFFQAEDGIRDYKVTGVQTCALPICPLRGQSGTQLRLRRSVGYEHQGPGRGDSWLVAACLAAGYGVQLDGQIVCGVQPVRLLFVNGDRKSTRLNSSHLVISYAVFCLKKKK